MGNSPDNEILFDVVTPTFNRPNELVEQAKRIGKQLRERDRWIIVDDASAKPLEISAIVEALEKAGGNRKQIEFIGRAYSRNGRLGTVQYARHIGCSMARADAWVVEIDDHDFLYPDALAMIRAGIGEGGVFVYGDVIWVGEDGRPGKVFEKDDYRPWMLRESHCPTEGVRAFPARLYRDVGGYRWEGRVGEVNECEFPGGDYGLFLRMETALDGGGFVRVPFVLCESRKAIGSISSVYTGEQARMAGKLRVAAKSGLLKLPPLSEPAETAIASHEIDGPSPAELSA